MGLSDKGICVSTKKELIFSPRTIGNNFKKHFPNLASDLVKKFHDTKENLECIQCAKTTRELTSAKKTLKFEKVSLVTILKMLKKFKTNKATGVDNLARRFLKDGSDTFCTICSFVFLRFNFGFTDFFVYINDMLQTANSKILSCVDDTCLIFKHKDIKTIEEDLNRDFQL